MFIKVRIYVTDHTGEAVRDMFIRYKEIKDLLTPEVMITMEVVMCCDCEKPHVVEHRQHEPYFNQSV